MNISRGMNFFWLAFGLFIMEESYRLNLGQMHKPDSGLFPFLIGILITALAIILLIQAYKRKSAEKEKKGKINYKNILLTLLFLYVYALIFEWLGFIFSAFLLIFFLMKVIEQKGWVLTIIIALLASFGSYVLFELWLQAALPKGNLWNLYL